MHLGNDQIQWSGKDKQQGADDINIKKGHVKYISDINRHNILTKQYWMEKSKENESAVHKQYKWAVNIKKMKGL